MNKVYDTAFSLIGQHLTLDNTIPASFGCAEAVSYVLQQCGYNIPPKGIPGTIALNDWLENNATLVDTPEAGDIIISVTQGNNHGHVGVVGHNAIISNDSQTGFWEPYWSMNAWLEFYKKQKKLSTYFYRLS